MKAPAARARVQKFVLQAGVHVRIQVGHVVTRIPQYHTQQYTHTTSIQAQVEYHTGHHHDTTQYTGMGHAARQVGTASERHTTLAGRASAGLARAYRAGHGTTMGTPPYNRTHTISFDDSLGRRARAAAGW